MVYIENPEKDQDRVFDTFDHYKRYGQIMFKTQRIIYENIAKRVCAGSILEAGAGIGVGGHIISATTITDKLKDNVLFGKQLYPQANWDVWDVATEPYKTRHTAVVAVEMIEHVKKYKKGIENLIASANKEVWISTPNQIATGESQPSNPYHVREFTPKEMLQMIGKRNVQILHWETFEELDDQTLVNPLVYKITL